jgi:hypothetical protein
LTDQNLGRHLEVAEIFGSDLIRVVVGETGVDESLQAFVVWEGVTYYLPPEAVEATLRFVGSGPHTADSRTAPDLGLSFAAEPLHQSDTLDFRSPATT